MAKHAECKEYNLIFILLIFCVIIVLGIITYLYIIPYFNINLDNENTSISGASDTSADSNNNILKNTSENYKIFENAPHLHSDEFELIVSNGISTINGKIFNTSNETVSDINCLYTLTDCDNNIVYEFTIYAKQIESQDSFGFTSVVILDLSNVEDYSVKLYNNQ